MCATNISFVPRSNNKWHEKIEKKVRQPWKQMQSGRGDKLPTEKTYLSSEAKSSFICRPARRSVCPIRGRGGGWRGGAKVSKTQARNTCPVAPTFSTRGWRRFFLGSHWSESYITFLPRESHSTKGRQFDHETELWPVRPSIWEASGTARKVNRTCLQRSTETWSRRFAYSWQPRRGHANSLE